MGVHNFRESLEKSHSASDLPIWEEIYRKAFPSMIACIDHRQDGEHQRAGIDRSIVLENSKQILIDEKIRWKDYGDILLEYMSNDRFKSPGWVCKPLRADYICYAIANTGKAYMLPVPQLQQAWANYGSSWIQSYPTRAAKNDGYNTLNTPVPVNVLFKAIGETLRVNFTAVA